MKTFISKLESLKEEPQGMQKSGISLADRFREILGEAQQDMPVILASTEQILRAVDALLALFRPCPPAPNPAPGEL